MSTLEKLEQLTSELPVILSAITTDNKNGHVNYTPFEQKGSCHGIAIYNDDTIAVQRAFMSKGTSLPPHYHDEIEVLTIFQGMLQITFIDGKQTFIGVGDTYKFNPKESHYCEALEDTWMIAITIPPSKDYPDGRKQ